MTALDYSLLRSVVDVTDRRSYTDYNEPLRSSCKLMICGLNKESAIVECRDC